MNFKAIIKNALYSIRHFIYPSYCFDCHGEVEPFEEFCSLCSGFLDDELLPETIETQKKAISKIYSCYHFENPIIRKAVHAVKYDNFPAPSLSLVKKRVEELEFDSIDFIAPVPLHWRRKRWRGYNQAELIGKVVSKYLNVDQCDCLKRNRHTKTQTKRKRWQRKQAMKEVFSLKQKHENLVKGKTILLIDDVCTTGATANECAEILMKHGAKEVQLFTLARA